MEKSRRKLRTLSAGNYESPILNQPIPRPVDDIYLHDIDGEITKIQRENDRSVKSELQLPLAKQTANMWMDKQRRNLRIRERHRLARELHGSVSQQLFAAMMMMSALN